jgi:hypothetical protein
MLSYAAYASLRRRRNLASLTIESGLLKRERGIGHRALVGRGDSKYGFFFDQEISRKSIPPAAILGVSGATARA